MIIPFLEREKAKKAPLICFPFVGEPIHLHFHASFYVREGFKKTVARRENGSKEDEEDEEFNERIVNNCF